MSSSSVNDALMRSDIDEEDWKEMDSLEAGSSSSSAYSNPLKSLVASFEVDSSNTKGNSNNIGAAVADTISYFSESAVGSGAIMPVRYKKMKAKGGVEDGGNRTYGDGDDDENEDERVSKPLLPTKLQVVKPDVTTVSSSNSAYVECCFIFIQGLLAGFAIIISFATISLNGATHPDFLSSYSRVAGQMRRFLYLLSTISLVGSLDSLLAKIYHEADGTAEYKLHVAKITVSIVASLMYCVVFVTTIILSQTDTLLTLQFGLKDDNASKWYNKALLDSEIVDELESWDIGDRLRLTCAVIGWVSCCVCVYLDRMSWELLMVRKEETERQVNAWKWKVDELQGNAQVFEQIAQISGNDRSGLSTAVSALRKLMAVQQVHQHSYFL